jgi:hypothetical protein
VIANSRSHRGRDAQVGMHSAEIVVDPELDVESQLSKVKEDSRPVRHQPLSLPRGENRCCKQEEEEDSKQVPRGVTSAAAEKAPWCASL